MTAVQVVPDSLLSVRAAAAWLERHGVRPFTRHAVLVAIAKGSLRVAATAKREILLRESDLEEFAQQSKTASHA